MPREEITGERPSNYSKFHREILPEWCYMTDGDWFEQRWINNEFKLIAYVETIQVPSLEDDPDRIYPVWSSKKGLCGKIEAKMGIPAYVVWHNEACTKFFVQRALIEAKGRTMNQSEYIDFILTLGGRSLFPNSLADLLEFEETEYLITIRPQGFLGSENFGKIMKIVREAGGKYVSSIGKDSYFTIPKTTPKERSVSVSLKAFHFEDLMR